MAARCTVAVGGRAHVGVFMLSAGPGLARMHAVFRRGCATSSASSSFVSPMRRWIDFQTSQRDKLYFVPPITDPGAAIRLQGDVALVHSLLDRHQRTVVVTGAGCSTESGSPDYRSPKGSYSSGHKPVTFQNFVKSHANRQRYWARGIFGFPLMKAHQPNAAHYALAALQRHMQLHGLITQNVDGLHTAAGAHDVVELHGSMMHVDCMGCGNRFDRVAFQEEAEELNGEYIRDVVERRMGSAVMKADGDADFGDKDYSFFKIPFCRSCGPNEGFLKPGVVFFGENIAAAVKQRAYALMEEADSVLVVGTSLEVPSARRLVEVGLKRKLPIIVASIGPNRLDDSPGVVRVEQQAGALLEGVATLAVS